MKFAELDYARRRGFRIRHIGVVFQEFALGIRSVVFSPTANRPDNGDWLTAAHANTARLGRAALDSARAESG